MRLWGKGKRMNPSVEAQIEALEAAWEREISRCHLGASPYDDDDLPDADLPTAILEIDRDE